MRLEEALAESDLGAAKRPFYNMPVDPVIDKVIISIGYLDDIYVAHADRANASSTWMTTTFRRGSIRGVMTGNRSP